MTPAFLGPGIMGALPLPKLVREQMLNSDNPFIRQFLSWESQGPLAMD